MIYADGTIAKDRHILSLGLIDEEHIVKFRNFLKTDATIVKHNNGGFDGYISKPAYILSLSDETIVTDLKKLGCGANKTHSLNYPTNDMIPEEFQRHFIRGFFDGDGSIYKRSSDNTYGVSIIGTQQMLKGIQDYLIKHRIINDEMKYNKTISKDKNIVDFKIHKTEYVNNFFEHIYKDAQVYLDRKMKKFQEFKDFYDESNLNFHIVDKKCCVCGYANEDYKYYRWHSDDEYNRKILCLYHYSQLKKYGRIIDTNDKDNKLINVLHCIGTDLYFMTMEDACKWASLKNVGSIQACFDGRQHGAGKNPITGEQCKWEKVIMRLSEAKEKCFIKHESFYTNCVYDVDGNKWSMPKNV